MISFRNDYSEGACPEILVAMLEGNLTQHVGYGMDPCCEQAKKTIQKVLEHDTCDIHFLVGGTQANLTVISSILRPYEAVIAVDSGHINVHETGAIEATGHKVVIAQGYDGKLSVEGIRDAVRKHEDEHMVKPAMVYISNATEIGTIYHAKELKAIRDVCDELGLYLFMDGARLGSALTAEDNDVEFDDLCKYCDIFYIGGTKNGALFGEAVVIVNEKLKKEFRYMIKQRGGMLAKGWLLGLQFQTLFEEGLYLSIAKHANQMAQKLQMAMKELKIPLLIETTTNQIFPILKKDVIQTLEQHYAFQTWESIDEETTAMRFVTSWATKEEDVDALILDLQKIYRSNPIQTTCYGVREIKDELLKFAVMICTYQGNYVFVKHKERETYEFPGGHREAQESIEACAKRELWEETGAKDVTLHPAFAYGVSHDGQTESFGMVFTGEILTFEDIPAQSEIRERYVVPQLPKDWTYPKIQPILFEYATSIICCPIEDVLEKKTVVRDILTQLPQWFGIPENTQTYIEESQHMPCWKAMKQGELVGCIALKETSPYCLEIYVMGVSLHMHHQGVGTALYKAAYAYALKKGYRFLQVKTVKEGCYPEYDQTNAFYRQMGFLEMECLPSLWDAHNPCQVYLQKIQKTS